MFSLLASLLSLLLSVRFVQTSALVLKLSHARDLLHLLPNIDVSQSEQEEETKRLDDMIQRKRQLIQAYNIREQQQQQQQEAAHATAAATVEATSATMSNST